MTDIDRPLTHTVPALSKRTGVCEASIWNLIREGKLDVIRNPGGIKRTLVTDQSATRLFGPRLPAVPSGSEPQPPTKGASMGPPPKRGRGRPRKRTALQAGATA